MLQEKAVFSSWKLVSLDTQETAPKARADPAAAAKSLQSCPILGASENHRNETAPVPQTVTTPSAMRETWVRSLEWEDPLEKETATHSSILLGESLWTEEPGGL